LSPVCATFAPSAAFSTPLNPFIKAVIVLNPYVKVVIDSIEVITNPRAAPTFSIPEAVSSENTLVIFSNAFIYALTAINELVNCANAVPARILVLST
jgi:hypothetical protein